MKKRAKACGRNGKIQKGRPRSAKTGKFVTKTYAKKHPATTVWET